MKDKFILIRFGSIAMTDIGIVIEGMEVAGTMGVPKSLATLYGLQNVFDQMVENEERRINAMSKEQLKEEFQRQGQPFFGTGPNDVKAP